MGVLPRLGRALAAGLLCLGALAGQASAFTSGPRYAAMVVEARTGEVLAAHHADETRHPASLTKMMTLYLLFEALRDGRLSLASPIRFSAEAASRPPSKIGVPAGGSISVEGAILALVTRSANDVATAVAEALAGSEEGFARVMTQRARQMGMARTTFRNASGLPDPEQVTTARDMVLLGRRLIQDFPDRYHYFSVTHFQHGQRLIRNHNGMLLDYPGADGIKTGFINASGFNIVTSAQRDGVRLVGAVFGGRSWVERNQHMAELFDEAFQRLGVRAAPALAAAQPRVMAAREAGATVSPAMQRRAEAQAQARLVAARSAPSARAAAATRPGPAASPPRAAAMARPAPGASPPRARAAAQAEPPPRRQAAATPRAPAAANRAAQPRPAARPVTRSTEAPRAPATRIAAN
ncbi:D-alanyl-D-alanine carboxypeptidase family protein [Rubritepida flocculans]|uniref:D-alanyl-D-alanine carboxypeptidase family protein n=1 Tax=Rubritepida flocculans TaxID=182403 RepID=UPI00040712B7|nr:D-alanyl-D-alanine carboxypeptidase family protein [Rubritepida flocculans]